LKSHHYRFDIAIAAQSLRNCFEIVARLCTIAAQSHCNRIVIDFLASK
jgi:hypothetical protein